MIHSIHTHALFHTVLRHCQENRHVMCVVEKAGFEPRTLGTGVERATNCATAPQSSLGTFLSENALAKSQRSLDILIQQKSEWRHQQEDYCAPFETL